MENYAKTLSSGFVGMVYKKWKNQYETMWGEISIEEAENDEDFSYNAGYYLCVEFGNGRCLPLPWFRGEFDIDQEEVKEKITLASRRSKKAKIAFAHAKAMAIRMIRVCENYEKNQNKNQNTCEGCGAPIDQIGICPACTKERERNRQDFTGFPGDNEILKDFKNIPAELREREENIKRQGYKNDYDAWNPQDEYSSRRIHPKDFISQLYGR